MRNLDRNAPIPRGSTLLLVTILLGVLAVVGVAAVSLGSQERVNAAAKGKRDMMAACASAARMAIWAEVARYGTSRLKEPLTEAQITLGDGTILSAPAHYADVPGLQVVQVNSHTSPSGTSRPETRDSTNTFLEGPGQGGMNAYVFSARCRDAKGRETEVEFSTMLMF